MKINKNLLINKLSLLGKIIVLIVLTVIPALLVFTYLNVQKEKEKASLLGEVEKLKEQVQKLEITPTPTLSPTPTLIPTATTTPKSKVPTPTLTPILKRTLTSSSQPPVILNPQQNSPIPTVAQNPIKQISMYPENEMFSIASGYTNIQKMTQNTSGHNDYKVWGEYTHFYMDNSIKIYLCSASGCVSGNGLQLANKNDGYYSFNGTISTYDDIYSKFSMVKVWEIKTSDINTTCSFTGYDPDPNDKACLRGNF